MRVSLFLLSFAIALFPSLTAAHKPKYLLTHVHEAAIKHSSSFAHDLRVVLGGVFLAQPDSLPTQNVYCVSSNGVIVSGGNDTVPSPTITSTSTTSSSLPTPTSIPLSPWKKIAIYSGSNFFDDWTFFTDPDPTNGNVQYVDRGTARSAGLVDINKAGNAVMKVETTPTVGNNRMSVRITTNLTFTEGLVILHAVHIPTGCGTWPAFWTTASPWPDNGEIDIVEGINDFTNNQATIHTGVGCSIPTSNSSLLGITGDIVGGTDCSAAQSNNQGCGMRSPSNTSFGSGFNSVGGGVYAMYWNNNVGIKIWHFQNGSIPSDITADAPQPENWSTPMAYWPNSNGCNISDHFKSHSAIFDTTVCGDWAEGAWNSAGVLEQSVSCQQQTGFATCAQFMQASGSSFNEAYWEIKSVNIYQDTSTSGS